jgi:hypothetical protein
MRRICHCVLVAQFLSGGLSLVAGAQTHFRRGVNIHHALNWAALVGSPDQRYVFPPFADRSHDLAVADLRAIRSAGFDFVRMTVDPGPFLQFQGAQRDSAEGILLNRVQIVLDVGLAVIVDIHPNNQTAEYKAAALADGVDGKRFSAYVSMLARIAARLRPLDRSRVALEIMNEPPVRGGSEADAAWERMLIRAYAAIRQRAPNLTLIVSGAQAGSAAGLMGLNPRPFVADPAVLFTFHYYEPYTFTHQSTDQVDAFRWLRNVPYPASERSIHGAMTALAASASASPVPIARRDEILTQSRAMLNQYAKSNFNHRTIEAAFDSLTAWAARYRLAPSRVLLGEFGVMRTYGHYQGAENADRVRWLSDVRIAAESHRIPWAVWVYKGYGGMAIVTADDSSEIDPLTARALGLNAPTRPN